jgi:hypothetical protein
VANYAVVVGIARYPQLVAEGAVADLDGPAAGIGGRTDRTEDFVLEAMTSAYDGRCATRNARRQLFEIHEGRERR